MEYGMTVRAAAPFADTVARVREALKEQEFAVLRCPEPDCCPAGTLLAARRTTQLNGRDICDYTSPWAALFPAASASVSILARRV